MRNGICNPALAAAAKARFEAYVYAHYVLPHDHARFEHDVLAAFAAVTGGAR